MAVHVGYVVEQKQVPRLRKIVRRTILLRLGMTVDGWDDSGRWAVVGRPSRGILNLHGGESAKNVLP